MTDNEKYVLQGADNDAEMATMRNVAGEIKGAEAAVKKMCIRDRVWTGHASI